jgi:hypothetical protein
MSDANVIKSYLVSLGYTVPDDAKFKASLKQMDDSVSKFTDGLGGRFVKMGLEITAVYTAIGSATVGLMDKVAQADLGYQLYATKMYMSVDAAKRLKIATDALGHSLEEIAWNPELRGRFFQLQRDQMGMQHGLGGDYETQMRNIRDIRFEFTRLKVEGEYLGQNMVVALMREFGGTDKVLQELKGFNEWFQKNLPQISADVAKYWKPVLMDMVDLGKSLGAIVKTLTEEFVRLTGEVSGDEGLKRGEISVKNIASATEVWLHALTNVLVVINEIIGAFTSHPELMKIAAGAYLGGKFGGGAGAILGGGAGAIWSLATDSREALSGNTAAQSSLRNAGRDNVKALVLDYAKRYGVPDSIALSIAQQESGFNQSTLSPKGAIGVMQLMPGTARQMGVNPYDLEQNISGGMRYLSQMHDQFGDWSTAAAAYNAGPGNVSKGRIPAETAAYVPSVMNRAAQIQGDNITVHVTQTNANPHEIASAVGNEVRRVKGYENQRTMQATGGPY